MTLSEGSAEDVLWDTVRVAAGAWGTLRSETIAVTQYRSWWLGLGWSLEGMTQTAG